VYSQELPDSVIHYDLFEEDHLIVVRYPEKIHEIQIISFMEFIYSNLSCRSLKKALVDFRQCKFNFKISELRNISNRRLQISEDMRSVLLVHNEMQTAYSMFFAHQVKTTQVCSTMDYAIRLLNLKTSAMEMEEIMKNLDLGYSSVKV
jgi:hypothetical protein